MYAQSIRISAHFEPALLAARDEYRRMLATAGDSVLLPPAVQGLQIVVRNSGAASLNDVPTEPGTGRRVLVRDCCRASRFDG
jgi:hypothetical protein